MTLTVEEHLRRAEHSAAVLRYLSNLASKSQEPPDPRVLSGIGDVAEDIEATIRTIRQGLAGGSSLYGSDAPLTSFD